MKKRKLKRIKFKKPVPVVTKLRRALVERDAILRAQNATLIDDLKRARAEITRMRAAVNLAVMNNVPVHTLQVWIAGDYTLDKVAADVSGDIAARFEYRGSIEP